MGTEREEEQELEPLGQRVTDKSQFCGRDRLTRVERELQ